MAVPKKRTPKSRRNSRRSVWFSKAFENGKKALAFSKSWVPIDLEEENDMPTPMNDMPTPTPTPES